MRKFSTGLASFLLAVSVVGIGCLRIPDVSPAPPQRNQALHQPTQPAGEVPLFDPDAFYRSFDGRHPSVVAKEWTGKTYVIRFTVDSFISTGESAGLCGSKRLAIKLRPGVKIGDTIDTQAVFVQYLPTHRDGVVFVFRLVE